MRAPATKTGPKGMRATQPSTPASNVRQAGPQGTPGGKARRVSRNQMQLGQPIYLWILVVIEVALLGGFRKLFRRVHGG